MELKQRKEKRISPAFDLPMFGNMIGEFYGVKKEKVRFTADQDSQYNFLFSPAHGDAE